MSVKAVQIFATSLLLARGEARAAAGVLIATEAIQPQAAIDDQGNVHLVFIHRGNIAVSISKDRGKTFGEPVVAIDTKGRAEGGRQRGPRIGLDRKRNIYVTAFVVFDEGEYKNRYPAADLCLVSSADGGRTWTKPVRVNEVPKKAPEALHWLAVSPAGEAHVAWLDIRSRAKGQDLYYARVEGGKVGKNVPVASDVCECCAPGLAVDSRGNPLLAYREGGAGKPSREIYVRYSTDRGASFSKPAQINRKKSNEEG
jgi:hypothetical protein